MHRLRRRLRAFDLDGGMGLVEVIVAMFIFALVSIGFVYSMTSVLSVSRDTRARQVATNLAAEEIDLARDADDLFALLDDVRTVELNGDAFTVSRKATWVSDPGADFTCGAGSTGSPLRYKRVNVEVTWDNMRPSTTPVRSDTVLNPAEHINDPAKGTVLVSVLNGAGTGSSGVSVSTSPSTGSTIPATDAQGCTYALKVNPGTYTVTISRSNYVSNNQASSESQVVQVQAGATSSVGFQYDEQAVFTARLASDRPSTVTIPTNLKTTFWNTYGIFARSPNSTSGLNGTFRLHPFASGYQAYAGECTAGDPGAWPVEDTPDGTLQGVREEVVAALPGETAETDVPMGYVTITSSGNSNRYLRAVSQAPIDPANPDCETQTVYTFGQAIPSTSGSQVTIALPYGTWKLYRGSNSTTQNTAVANSVISFPSPAIPERSTIDSAGVITLDPRVVVESEVVP